MSRGPGRVMRALRAEVVRTPRVWQTYEQLARVIYSTDAPPRAQLVAVGRAARRLADARELAVARDEEDARVPLVGAPWLWHDVLSELDYRSLPVDELADRLRRESPEIHRACQELADAGEVWFETQRSSDVTRRDVGDVWVVSTQRRQPHAAL